MTGFGMPNNDNDDNTQGEGFDGFGLTGDAGKLCIGLFDACATKLKFQKGAWCFLEFTITDPDFAGEEYSIGAPKITPDMRGKQLKNARRAWLRLGQALRACGVEVGSNQLPINGASVIEDEQPPCRLAVSTYVKNGADEPTIVWGRPKSRMRGDMEVGFPAELQDENGKFADYGCGVLPAE